MARVWQLQEAKNKLCEVIRKAVERGPQVITRRGVETAVVLSYAEYRKTLLSQGSVSEFFRDSPLAGMEIDLRRDTSTTFRA